MNAGPADDRPPPAIARGDKLLALLLWVVPFLVLTGVLLLFTARPITWDELLYMEIAFDPYSVPWVLNRYAHIYLLAAFMRLFREPYFATQLFWSTLVASSLVTAVWLCRSTGGPVGRHSDRSEESGLALEPAQSTRDGRSNSSVPHPGKGWATGTATPMRVFVGLLTTLLLLGQVTMVWFPGLAYPDFTVMFFVTISVAAVFRPVAQWREIAWWRTVLLGLLFVLAFKSKETAAVLLALPALFFISRDSRLRCNGAALGRLALYLVGVALGIALLCGADALWLGDAWHGLRPEHWATWRRFNTGESPASEWSWLSWMLRPLNFTSFALYGGAVLLAASRERNLRLVLLSLLPLGFLLMLVLIGLFGNPSIAARYTIPILPAMCLFAAAAAGRLIDRTAAAARQRRVSLWAASVIVGVTLLSLCLWKLAPAELTNREYAKRVLAPLTLLLAGGATALALGGLHRLRAPALLFALTVLCVSATSPAVQVLRGLAERGPRTQGDARYSDMAELLTSAAVADDSRILLDRGLYDGELWNRGRWAFYGQVHFNSARRVPRERMRIEDVAGLDASELLEADLIVAPPATADTLLAKLPPDAFTRRDGSSQGKVSILKRVPHPVSKDGMED